MAMHPAKLRDAFVIGTEPPQQPHQLHIAPALAFQTARGSNLLQISVQIQLQQISRIVSWTPRLLRLRLHKSQLLYIQPVDESVNHPTKMFVGYKLFQAHRKQRPLRPRIPFDESHRLPSTASCHRSALPASSFVTASKT